MGANFGRLQAYTPSGFPDWSLASGFTTIDGTGYSVVNLDVVPIPFWYAFSFLRLGGPERMTLARTQCRRSRPTSPVEIAQC